MDNGLSMALIAHCLAMARFSSLIPTGAPLISWMFFALSHCWSTQVVSVHTWSLSP